MNGGECTSRWHYLRYFLVMLLVGLRGGVGGGKKYIRRESLLSGPRFDPVFSLVRPRNINTFLQLAVVLLQV